MSTVKLVPRPGTGCTGCLFRYDHECHCDISSELTRAGRPLDCLFALWGPAIVRCTDWALCDRVRGHLVRYGRVNDRERHLFGIRRELMKEVQ